MKIAKKVLALVMALAMVAALGVMAFAETSGTYAITAAKDDDGYIVARVALKNGAGTEADSFTVKYDSTTLKVESEDDVVPGKDAEDMAANIPSTKNQLLGGPNIGGVSEGTELPLGDILYGYAFAASLSSADLKPGKGKTTAIDPNDFEFLAIYFTVINDKATETTIQVLDSNGAVADSVTVKLAEAPVEEPSKAEEKPTEEEPTKADETPTKVEEDTKASNPGTGDKKTGDNMALAAAGAVVALAGVAFVISKKRK